MAGGNVLRLCCVLAVLGLAEAAPPPAMEGKEQIVPDMVCDRGYVLEGNKCVKTSYKPPTMACPPGFEPSYHRRQRPDYSDDTDERSYRSPSSFRRKPRSYRRDGENGEEHGRRVRDCVRKITAPPRPYCPDGFEAVAGKRLACRKYIRNTPVPYCRSGYDLRADGCVRTTVHSPSLECADNSFTMVGNECQKIIEMGPMEGCPEGYMMEGDRCVRVERQSPFAVCPQGTEPVGDSCLLRVVVPARSSCPAGYEKAGNECIREDKIELEMECDGDSIMQPNGECVNEVILDAGIRCEEDGFTLESSGDCVKRMKPVPYCEDGIYNKETNKCERKESVLGVPNCPEGYEQVGDDCILTDILPLEFDCPNGFQLSGESCSREQRGPPDEQCPEGFLKVENSCLRPTYKKKWEKCQRGFTLLAGRCTATEEMAPDMICPPGFDLKVNKCVQERHIPPEHRCGPKSELKDGHCVQIVTRPSKEDCDKPYRYNRETGLCEDEEIVPPELECPPGYTYKGDCIRVDTTAPRPRCPDHHHYDSYYNNCKPDQRYVPARLSAHVKTAPHATITKATATTTDGKKSGGASGFSYKPVSTLSSAGLGYTPVLGGYRTTSAYGFTPSSHFYSGY